MLSLLDKERWGENLRYSRRETCGPQEVYHSSRKEQMTVCWEEVWGYTWLYHAGAESRQR